MLALCANIVLSNNSVEHFDFLSLLFDFLIIELNHPIEHFEYDYQALLLTNMFCDLDFDLFYKIFLDRCMWFDTINCIPSRTFGLAPRLSTAGSA